MYETRTTLLAALTCLLEFSLASPYDYQQNPVRTRRGYFPVLQPRYTNTSALLNTQTVTEPDGSEVTLTLPSGSTITGEETITTDGSTLTVAPVTTGTVTSTITTDPPSLSIEPFTDSSITANTWLTTTGADSSTTIVPIILPCATCQPEIVWNLPPVPNVEFDLPGFPNLPKFHLPCVKIFGIHVSGECPPSGGPSPTNDGPPDDPQPADNPNDPTDTNNPDQTNTPTETQKETQTSTGTSTETSTGTSTETHTTTSTCTTSTVTDYFVSCDPSSSSCTTTSSEVMSGCTVTASDTTTTASACGLSIAPTGGVISYSTVIVTVRSADGTTSSDTNTTPPSGSPGTTLTPGSTVSQGQTTNSNPPGTDTSLTPISSAATTSFISCSSQNQDPDQGITEAYCVCSGSTFAQTLNTDVSPVNSCAYTSLPDSTITSAIQTITETLSDICSVCTYTGQNANCQSLDGCTTTPTATPTPTDETSTGNAPEVTLPPTAASVALLYFAYYPTKSDGTSGFSSQWNMIDGGDDFVATVQCSSYTSNSVAGDFETTSLDGTPPLPGPTVTFPSPIFGHNGCVWIDVAAPGPTLATLSCEDTAVACAPRETSNAEHCNKGHAPDFTPYAVADCYFT